VRDPRNSPAADVIAGLRARGAAVAYHDPHVASFRATDGIEDESVPLDDLLASSDVTVVVTPHREIDWDAVYARSDLVVDTVDSSRGRSVRPRQVLRLGAGWAVRT
jgi:UDP-N-acetyl-D-glucosamine dehydrogenase